MGKSFNPAIVLGRAVGLNLVFIGADLQCARGQNQVLVGDGRRDIARRQPFGLQLMQVEIHLHLTLLAAVRIGHSRAANGDELRPDEVEAEVVELLFGEALARDAELQNRNARGTIVDDEWWRRACRKLPQLRLRNGRHLRDGHRNIYLRLEVQLHHRDAIERVRLDVVDIVDRRGESALRDRDDTIRHVFGGEALILPDDAHHRDIDIGKDIDRRGQNGKGTDDQEQQRKDGEGIWPSQGESNNPHRL